MNLTQMTIIYTTAGRNPSEEMEQPSWSTKESEIHYLEDKPFNIPVIQVYASTSNAEEAEVEWFCDDLQDLLELTPKKMSFLLQGTGMQKQEVKKHLE